MKIQRQPSTDEGTFGEFFDDQGTHICYTAELPWNDNHPETSCIPAGTYQVIPHSSANHPNVWEISEVPSRTAILIHNGNLPLTDSKGCIIVGEFIGTLQDAPAVLNSNATLAMLRNVLPQNFSLEILDAIA